MLLKKATKKEIGTITNTLVRAFCKDLLLQHLSCGSERVLQLVFQALVLQGLKFGKVYVSSFCFEAVAIWVPSSLSAFAILASGWKQLLVCSLVNPRATWRIVSYLLFFCSEIEERVVPGLHWTLFPLGVDPNYQYQGKGTALMEEALEQFNGFDELYMDTDPETEGFYKRLGFQVVQKTPWKNGLVHVAMVRPAGVSVSAEAKEFKILVPA